MTWSNDIVSVSDGDSGDGGASITVKGVSQQVQSHTSHPPVTTVGLMAAVSMQYCDAERVLTCWCVLGHVW